MRFDLIFVILGCLATPSLLVSASSADEQTSIGGNEKAIMIDKAWGVKLQFDGYRDWTDHPLYGKPNFVLAGKSKLQSCEVQLSMFAEVVASGITAHECRKSYPANPEKLKTRSDVSQIEERKNPITYSLFDQHHVFKELPFVQKQLYGYWTRNDICFELHVSSVNCTNFKDLAIPILESVRIFPDNGATHETVMLARKLGKDPGDWRIHLAVAGVHLYAKPPRNVQARRFYTSALQRAGTELDTKSEWIIQEGIALAWLFEDNGEKALPYLMRALEITNKGYVTPAERSETFTNIACAYALMGEIEKSCNELSKALAVLSTVSPSNKERALEEIRTDKQLASVRNSECYRSLMKGEEKK